MFYEFSIQYDDPVILVLDKTPLSDILYFKVNHAYPNWIPPHYLRMVDDSKSACNSNTESNSLDSDCDSDKRRKPTKLETSLPAQQTPESFFTFPFFGSRGPDHDGGKDPAANLSLEFRRYVHLAHTFLDSYLPSDVINSPQDSVAASAIRVLSPLVPQGNWTTGANPPAPNEFFYRHFPKVSPDFDNDYHTRNPGVFWGWFYLTRWLPELIQKVMFPLNDVVYDSKIEQMAKGDANAEASDSLHEKASQYIPKARKLTGRQTPTLLECQLCSKFQGFMLWNRQHDWFCVYKDKLPSLIGNDATKITKAQLDDENFRRNHVPQDNDGKRYFTSFNDFIEWNTEYTEKLIELERKAYGAKDMDEMTAVEAEIYELKTLRKRRDKITADHIVSVKG